MAKRSTVLSVCVVAVAATACGPPKAGDDSPPLIETQCDAFCERAIRCESEEFATDWGFTTHSECVDDCLRWTQGAVDIYMDPNCEVILGDEWECAGMIDDCSVWRSYEDRAFGMIVLGDLPCRDEHNESIDQCNP